MRALIYLPRAMVGDGGVTTAAWGWASALADAGWALEIAYDDALAGQTPDERVGGIALRHRGGLPAGVASALRGVDVLLLHSGWGPYNHVAARAAIRRGVPFVAVPHGAYEGDAFVRSPRKKALVAPVERGLLRRASAVHAFFHSEAREVRRFVPNVRTVVAPTGYDVPIEKWSGPGDYFAWVGRYDVFHKGLDLLLDAWLRLPPPARPRLRMHGRPYGTSQRDVERLVHQRGLGGWVNVGGPISGEQKRSFLKGSIGYLHTSRWESYGLALVEAMALGVPSLVTASCHIAGPIDAHHAAIVVQPDANSIACGVVALADSAALGSVGRAFVERELNWSDLSRSFIAQLDVVL